MPQLHSISFSYRFYKINILDLPEEIGQSGPDAPKGGAMADRTFTRRTILEGGAALAGTLAFGGFGNPSAAGKERPALAVFWLNGGPAGLFNSAGSFLTNGAFGVTGVNVLGLGNDLVVDACSFGALPAAARSHMASVNFRHGILRPHEAARAAVLQSGQRSQLLRLAAVLPPAPVRCAIVNTIGLPAGVAANPPGEDGVALERVTDLEPLSRLVGARELSETRAAYGLSGAGAIDDTPSTFAAAELLIRGGAAVVFAQPAFTGRADRQFDTHQDDSGMEARAVMAPITPSLASFLGRTLGLPGRNVVTLLVGEFSRTIPKSDHEPGGTATVIGRHVRTGTTGPQRPDGSPPENAPPPEALWAYVAAALRLDSHPFGRNPSPRLIA
jgi:hypothetical protein